MFFSLTGRGSWNPQNLPYEHCGKLEARAPNLFYSKYSYWEQLSFLSLFSFSFSLIRGITKYLQKHFHKTIQRIHLIQTIIQARRQTLVLSRAERVVQSVDDAERPSSDRYSVRAGVFRHAQRDLIHTYLNNINRIKE